MKDLALRELEKLKFGIIPRIVLYQKYDVDPNLIVPLYAKLCSRDKILTLEESEALGLQTSHLIFQGRERLRTSSGDGDKSPLPPGLEEEEVKNIIGTLMGITAAAPEDSEDKGKGKNTGGWVINSCSPPGSGPLTDTFFIRRRNNEWSRRNRRNKSGFRGYEEEPRGSPKGHWGWGWEWHQNQIILRRGRKIQGTGMKASKVPN